MAGGLFWFFAALKLFPLLSQKGLAGHLTLSSLLFFSCMNAGKVSIGFTQDREEPAFHSNVTFSCQLVKGTGAFQLLTWAMGSGLGMKCEFLKGRDLPGAHRRMTFV